ncbi:MAG: hypothetical protein PHT99_06025, partial [Methanoregula sp.]|nr:hypothetical protein [Methanoregula sp.]
QVHAFADELEQVKAELENSRRQRRGIEESLTGEKQEKERVLSDLERVSRERELLLVALEKEMQLRGEKESEQERLLHRLSLAETEGKSQESTLSATIRELNGKLESSIAQRAGLEEQVKALLREKQSAEEKAASLSLEIDQARAALADEWEDHMNAQERVAVAEHEKQQLERSLQRSEVLEPEKGNLRELIVKVPDLPVECRKQPQSLSAVTPAGPSESPVPHITNVDDLFEEEDIPEENDTGDEPIVSIIQEPSSDEDEEPADTGSDALSGLTRSAPDSENDEPVSDIGPESDDEDASESEPDLSSDEYHGDFPTGVFNRAQWFDLLKWAHHSGTLSPEQRMQIVRMGRLIQKGRKLTQKQEEQVMEMISLVQAQGYRFI